MISETEKSEMLQRARMRVIAKEFKSRIANGTCLQVPDDIIDRIDDKDIKAFKEACVSVGLRMNEDAINYGYWEKN